MWVLTIVMGSVNVSSIAVLMNHVLFFKLTSVKLHVVTHLEVRIGSFRLERV